MKKAKLILLQSSDFNEVLDLFSEKDIFEYISPWKNQSEEVYRTFLKQKLKEIENSNGFYWLLRDSSENKLIGAFNLTPIPDSNKIQIGWMISEKYRRQGWATFGAQQALRFALEKNISPVYGVCDKKNTASIRIFEGLNFVLKKSYAEGDSELLEYIHNHSNPE